LFLLLDEDNDDDSKVEDEGEVDDEEDTSMVEEWRRRRDRRSMTPIYIGPSGIPSPDNGHTCIVTLLVMLGIRQHTILIRMYAYDARAWLMMGRMKGWKDGVNLTHHQLMLH
jgi:hypothetical protein